LQNRHNRKRMVTNFKILQAIGYIASTYIVAIKYTQMAHTHQKKKPGMATASTKNKSSLETLLNSMDELAVSAAKRMSAEELREKRKEINKTIDRVVASGQRRRRETA
jgi:hypothetical protein